MIRRHDLRASTGLRYTLSNRAVRPTVERLHPPEGGSLYRLRLVMWEFFTGPGETSVEQIFLNEPDALRLHAELARALGINDSAPARATRAEAQLDSAVEYLEAILDADPRRYKTVPGTRRWRRVVGYQKLLARMALVSLGKRRL